MNRSDDVVAPSSGIFSGVKPPAVAGLFYPDAREALRKKVEALLQPAAHHQGDSRKIGMPRALLVPHAGYRYSGRVAGAGFHSWMGTQGEATIFLLGPSHRAPLSGFALPSHSHFQAPLGDVPVATDIAEELLGRDDVAINDEAFLEEHSLEVELPFLQVLFPASLRVVPLLVGRIAASNVSEVLATYWDRPRTWFVFSSDLSHFLDDRSAQKRDEATISHVLGGGSPSLTGEDACGYSALNGLLLWSLRRRLLPELFMMNNSAAAGGGLSRVVGYAAVGFWDVALASQDTATPEGGAQMKIGDARGAMNT